MTPKCPKCNSTMVIRTRKSDGHKFYGCSKYPKCKGTIDISEISSNPPSDSKKNFIFEKSKYLNDDNDSFFSETIPKTKVNQPLQFEAEPFRGFQKMESFQTIACEATAIEEINNDLIDRDFVKQISKFRIDLSCIQKHQIRESQSELLNIALRILCRGTITRNSKKIDQFIEKFIPGEPSFNENHFVSSRFGVLPRPGYDFDSKIEEDFANNVLSEILGNQWPLFVSTQVYIKSLGKTKVDDGSLASQKVDFYISTGLKGIIIELDGKEHLNHIEKDNERDNFLSANGLYVLRIKNEDLENKIEEVKYKVKSIVNLADYNFNFKELETKRIIASKIIHQIQIAILTALINSTISLDAKISIPTSINGFSTDQINELANEALKDLKELIDGLGTLYGITPFFACSVDLKQSDATLCFGSPIFGSPSTIQITDLSTENDIENCIHSFNKLQIVNPSEKTIHYLLNYIFPYDDFKEGQLSSVIRLLNKKDTIVLLPTGSGKSLIYQFASLICPGKIIVVSPLISLIEDQLFNLKNLGIECAVSVSRNNSFKDNEELLNNPWISLVYISPERLQIKGFRDTINRMQSLNKIYAVAIDEAHCISEWGHDFRTAYLNIGRTARRVFNKFGESPTIIALTGTASTAVLKDVKRELEISDYDAIITPETFDRKELNFDIVRTTSDAKSEQLLDLINRNIPDYFRCSQNQFYKLRNNKTNCGIVFCPHVNGDYGVLKVDELLKSNFTPVISDFYSGSKPKKGYTENSWEDHKHRTTYNFKSNKINTLVATKAFGMGIDKSNVRFTIHYGVPASIESFYQEAGRSGRDGQKALCIIMLSIDNQNDDYLLNPTTPVDIIQSILDNQGIEEKDDVSRMLWFHTRAFKGVKFELENTNKIIELIFEEDHLIKTNIKLKYADNDDLENKQKALQRLLVLGVVADYTIDYSAKEIFIFSGSDKITDIQEKYKTYVKGYNEGRIKKELEKLNVNNEFSTKQYVSNAVKVLTEFIYDTIEKGRRRSLKEIINAANAALMSADPNDTLRTRIVRYFESTYFEEINGVIESETLGFEKIPKIISGYSQNDEESITGGGIRSCNEAAGLRGEVSRQLESLPDHPGLLALRALAELLCKDYNAEQIRTDFEASCRFAIERYSCDTRTLKSFTLYFLREVIERDPNIFHYLINSKYLSTSKKELCSLLIASQNLTEIQKIAPALTYTSLISKTFISLINKLKGE